MLPTTGSTITAAIRSPCSAKARSTASIELYGSAMVVSAKLLRDAGRVREAQRGHARAGLDQQRIDVAVVAALELQVRSRPVKPRASRMALMVASVPELTRRTISMEGTASADGLGQLDFALGGRAEAGAACQRLLDRRDDLGMAVAQEQRPPGADVVDVLVAVGVPDVRALAAHDEGRRAAHAAERPHRRIHAAGDGLLRAGKQRFRSDADSCSSPSSSSSCRAPPC